MNQYYSNVHRKMAEYPTIFSQIANMVAKPIANILVYHKESQRPKYERQKPENEQQKYLIWLP